MKPAGAREPVFEVIGNLFKVTLFPVNGGVNGGVNYLHEYIRSNPGKKTADLKTVFKLPQRTLERWLKQLKGESKIEFRGPPKTGGYFTK